MNRIDRLSAILIQLQTKRVVKAEEIAERFEISLRTVYRDVKALMEAGVPIGSEAGKGYFIVDGYHLPPVMFTQTEASALMVAAKLVEKMTDRSVRESFESALTKIRAVLNEREKDHLETLQEQIEVWQGPKHETSFPDNFINDIQKAVVSREVLCLDYFSNYNNEVTKREVEPIGLFFYGGAWHLIAWCRLRASYRDFRVDRIQSLTTKGETYDTRNLITLKEYIATVVQSNREMIKVVVRFQKGSARYIGNSKYAYGFISEEEVDGWVRMTFLTCYIKGITRWLLMFGNTIEIESPELVREAMINLTEELAEHYLQLTTVN